MPKRILTDVKLPDFKDRPKKQGDILRTAEDLFMQFGYNRVTVEEICREANVSKVTFYKYYPNKFAVLEDYLGTRLELGWKTFDSIRLADAPLREKLHAMILMKESAVSHMTAVFYQSLVEGGEDVRGMLDKWTNMSMTAMRQFFIDGQAKGEISQDYNIDFLMHVFGVIVADTQAESLSHVYGDDLVRLSRDYMNFLFYGITGPPEEE
ncbi:MAG: TetR/AcrR family transcriptional regulator [Candidatus Marinimicrobia bacterium]|nr:TetR/AcrR family transcriptional regulator [Candidatus Neomarinimicrobiota bacterium]